MTIKLGLKYFLWMAVGVMIQLGIVLLIFHFYNEQNPAEQLARQAKRIALVYRGSGAIARHILFLPSFFAWYSA